MVKRFVHGHRWKQHARLVKALPEVIRRVGKVVSSLGGHTAWTGGDVGVTVALSEVGMIRMILSLLNSTKND